MLLMYFIVQSVCCHVSAGPLVNYTFVV